jgi:hypothetical protein
LNSQRLRPSRVGLFCRQTTGFVRKTTGVPNWRDYELQQYSERAQARASAPLAVHATSVRHVCPDIAPILSQLCARKCHEPHCVDCPSPRPLEIAKLSQSASASMSARNQDLASRARYE